VAGNEEAIYFNQRHESRICIYSKIADRDISNDIFQDTFIKVIKTLKSIHTMRR
jgi:RNA polymerase sigma-70 factor (ECF subfamily)